MGSERGHNIFITCSYFISGALLCLGDTEMGVTQTLLFQKVTLARRDRHINT